MDDSAQNEIERLRLEVKRLQGLLEAQQTPIPVRSDTASLIENHELVQDCARHAEGILSEQDVRKKWRLTDEDWERAGSDEELIETIKREKERRLRNGAHAREKAQQVFVETPNVLGNILRDNDASPRHRIEAAREIRAVAATGPDVQPASEMFTININLGGDEVIRFNKPIARGIDDNGNVIEQKPLPMIEDNN
jgi:hypothetical protein